MQISGPPPTHSLHREKLILLHPRVSPSQSSHKGLGGTGLQKDSEELPSEDLGEIHSRVKLSW